ncbi:MetQ/NlpA family ABC transporter substrate-binding protein [Nocardioides zeae]
MSDQLLEAPKSRTGLYAVIAAVVAIALVVGGYFLFIRDDGDAIRIGVVDDTDPYWRDFTDAAEDAGLDVEIVNFADYNQPNRALDEGELDLNQFQHLAFLAEHLEANPDSDIVPIGATAIYPLALYSENYDSIDAIPDGAEVVVPNDPSNQARALVILQEAGLIELEDGGTLTSDLSQVDEGASRVRVNEAAANFTAASLEDVAAAVINNDFIKDAGLDPEAALAQDDPEDERAQPYINIFAANAEDADNEDYRELVRIYHDTQKVQDGVLDASEGTAVLLDTPVADLDAALDEAREAVRNS